MILLSYMVKSICQLSKKILEQKKKPFRPALISWIPCPTNLRKKLITTLTPLTSLRFVLCKYTKQNKFWHPRISGFAFWSVQPKVLKLG